MNFAEAVVKYRELRKQLELGKPFSRSEFENRVSQLAVQDAKGTWWEIHPYTARWMYYDGAQWVQGIPPGRASSFVVPELSSATRSLPDPFASAEASANSERATAWQHQGPGHRVRRQFLGGANRIWITFAVASVVLLICVCLTFFVGQRSFDTMAHAPVPTQTRVANVSTPTPTITLQPTLPPIPATAVPVIGKIIESRVNVRAAPSTAAKIIGKVARDELLTLIARSQDGAWYQVRLADLAEASWVFGETLEITTGDPSTLPITR